MTASTSGFVPTKPTRTSTEGDVEYHWAMTMIADVKNIQNQAVSVIEADVKFLFEIR